MARFLSSLVFFAAKELHEQNMGQPGMGQANPITIVSQFGYRMARRTRLQCLQRLYLTKLWPSNTTSSGAEITPLNSMQKLGRAIWLSTQDLD